MQAVECTVMLLITIGTAVAATGCYVDGSRRYRRWAFNRAIERMWRNKRKQKPLCF